MIELLGLAGAMTLEGIGIFFYYRRKIALANKAVADLEKTVAEKNVIIEQRDKTIAEKDKLIAETELLGIDKHQKLVQVKLAQLELRAKLDDDYQQYQAAQHKLADLFGLMTKKIAAAKDASDVRNRLIKHLTGEVLDSFSKYVDKATVCYRGESTEVVALFLHTEIIPVVVELKETIDALNSPDILSHCAQSPQPLKLSQASLGSVLRCFAELLPSLLDVQRDRLANELSPSLQSMGVPFTVFDGGKQKALPNPS